MSITPVPSRLSRRTAALRRWGTVAVAAALMASGCSAPQGGGASASSAGTTSAAAGTTSAPAPSPSASGPVDPARSNPDVPMRAFSADEKPPQFILFSFDNGFHNERWESFRKAAKESKAHFTVFHSSVNLLTPENRSVYAAPGNKPGYIGTELAKSKADAAERIRNLNAAYAEGNEIGTHYNGHLCGGTPHGGDVWTTKEWKQELETFHRFYSDIRGANGFGEDFPQLTVPVSSIKGTRLPCLDGRWDQLVPAWKAYGIEYDTSQAAKQKGLSWPYVKDGIWEFEMPVVHSPALAEKGVKVPNVMAMDYNFWVSGNRYADRKDDTAWLNHFQLDTLRYMYASAYHGNRAPLVFGNHFDDWGGNAFNPAQETAMREMCVQADTYCVTYQQMVEWLKLQDPQVLEAWSTQPRSATGSDVASLHWRPNA